MTTAMKLTDTQNTVILAASQRTDGNIEPLPATLRGGARAKVIEGLLTRGYVKRQGKLYHLTDAGYAAVGRSRPQAAPKPKVPAKNSTGAQETPAAAKPHRTRENSKQAQVIAMLRRPEGATIPQICDVTGWQQHTVRGTFAGAFKKKLGLAIDSAKEPGGERVYYIVA